MRIPFLAACDTPAMNECHGRSQNQWARRCCDEHRQPADGITRDDPCGAGDTERHREQQQCVPVCQAYKWRLRSLRRRYKANDARIGAFACRRRSTHLEGLASVNSAAARRLPLAPVDGDRLARERGLVEHGPAARHHAVNRNDLAGPHQDRLAYGDLFDGHIFHRTLAKTVRDPWCSIHQRSKFALSPADGEVL
jgi:hypothetical protein